MSVIAPSKHPVTKVKAYTLEEGNILRINKGESSALALKTNDGCVRVGRSSVVRINKSTKKYKFETWDDLKAAMDKPRVSTKASENEAIVVVRKGDPFLVEPVPTFDEEGNEIGITAKEGHEHLMVWVFAGITDAMNRVQNATSDAALKWGYVLAGVATLVALIAITAMAIASFSSSGSVPQPPMPLPSPYIEPTPTPPGVRL